MRNYVLGLLSAGVLVPVLAAAQAPSPGPRAVFDVRCREGRAAGYPCRRVDLLAYLPFSALGAGSDLANDLWGFSEGGREFVLLGRGRGTYFVEITNPTAPVYLGRLRSHNGTRSPWRDIKVYRGHAFIVSEAFRHGMQVFDLGALLKVKSPPVAFEPAAHYSGEGLESSHNIAIDETSGFGFIVGSNTCGGGLHIVDLRNPKEPRFAGCFSGDGYTHDVQCVSYDGPDRDYRRRQVCFASNEDTLTIVDVTNKARPRQISRTSYPNVGYTHQSWTTEDRHFLLMGDELDEGYFGHDTKTRIWSITDLDRPQLIGTYTAKTPAIDHNLYVHRGYAYQANYRAGLRILSLDRIAEGKLSEVAYFDIYPEDDAPEFNGAWSVYPYFESGVVAVSGIEQGLFLLEPDLP